jgi:4-amino-4-deoxy-L-arabinose transferase-like glycosyltransferase
MDVPARLAAGERLYRDVTYNYGPAAPWLNALALRAGGHRWLVLEAVGVALAAAVLVLLYRLTRRAGSPLSALVSTTLAATFCLGAPHGGAFVFPYSFANLYALAGSLLVLLGYGSQRRGAPLFAALGLALALAARPEVGAATAFLLLAAGARSRVDRRPRLGRAVLIVLGGGLAAVAIYAAAFAEIPWQTLEREVPFLHLGSLPPEWRYYYRGAAGLLHPWMAARTLALGLALDALLLAVCAFTARRRMVLVLTALTAALAAWAFFVSGDELPPLLFPLPLIAPLAAAVVFVRRPFGPRERDRFLLFALAAVMASRVLFHLRLGAEMSAFAAPALPCALATAAILGLDVPARRCSAPAAFRRPLAAALLLLGGLFLAQLARAGADPRLVRLNTPAGALRLRAGEAAAVDGTLRFLAAQARAGDSLASFPEGGFFNFVSGHRNPLRETLLLPGGLDAAGEAAVVTRLDRERPAFLLLCHRPTAEFGTGPFGKGYAVGLWREVEERYVEVTPPFSVSRRRSHWFVRIYQHRP